MLQSISNIFKIPDLKKKILITAMILVIYRLGSFIPVPGINAAVLKEFLAGAGGAGNVFGMFDLFVGGNFGRASVFALGIMPYITTSIVIQLLGGVLPFFERLKKEGAEGQKKINQYTRYGTVAVAAFQAIGFSVFLLNLDEVRNFIALKVITVSVIKPYCLPVKTGFCHLLIYSWRHQESCHYQHQKD